MHKVTVLYKHPKDPAAFEKYYAETHLPIAATMEGVARLELTKSLSAADGQKADYYRMAELYFDSLNQLEETMSSPEGQAAVDDMSNFATGGVEVIIGVTEEN